MVCFFPETYNPTLFNYLKNCGLYINIKCIVRYGVVYDKQINDITKKFLLQVKNGKIYPMTKRNRFWKKLNGYDNNTCKIIPNISTNQGEEKTTRKLNL